MVRRPSEVGYNRQYRLHQIAIGDVAAPNYNYVIMSSPFLDAGTSYPPHLLLTFCRSQWVTRTPFFVGWHQAEYGSCPPPSRGKRCARVPSWWNALEVHFGAMVEPPPVLVYQLT